jgi:hypothetical protein
MPQLIMVAIISAVNKRFVFIVVVILVYTKIIFSALSGVMTERKQKGLSGITNFSISCLFKRKVSLAADCNIFSVHRVDKA